jgi:hypothetical protein
MRSTRPRSNNTSYSAYVALLSSSSASYSAYSTSPSHRSAPRTLRTWRFRPHLLYSAESIVSSAHAGALPTRRFGYRQRSIM